MTGNKADLHIHTTASDGTLTPEKVVLEAARIGLGGVGITDHDTVQGIPEAVMSGKKLGVMVVPGVEINSDVGESEVHMLGYFIDHNNPDIIKHLEQIREFRLDRANKIVTKLNELGVMISIDRVIEIAGSGAVGRPHIGKTIVEAGYADDINTAFGRFLIRGAPSYVPRYKINPLEAIEIIHAAGGIAAMAHPAKSRHDELIPELVKAGMNGLEVYHPDHSSAQVRHYHHIADRYGLLKVGGSDSHGAGMMKEIPVGCVSVEMSVVFSLQKLANGISP